MDEASIRKRLIHAGVRNLREFGYPSVTADNIVTDPVFSGFFDAMLRDNLGVAGATVDAVIRDLRASIAAFGPEQSGEE